ncbi:MAG TPA: hypothetical protein VK142_01095, partial [Bacillota bacterium]|nr:hypothetical protein [Bacillota bacterium]
MSQQSTIYRIISILMLMTMGFVLSDTTIYADDKQNIFEERKALYKKTEAITLIPWYYLAAIDQFERNKQTEIPE